MVRAEEGINRNVMVTSNSIRRHGSNIWKILGMLMTLLKVIPEHSNEIFLYSCYSGTFEWHSNIVLFADSGIKYSLILVISWHSNEIFKDWLINKVSPIFTKHI